MLIDFLVKYFLPKTLVALEKGCFKDCRKLKDISLPRTLSEISESCFEGSGLKNIRVPYGIQAHMKRTLTSFIL